MSSISQNAYETFLVFLDSDATRDIETNMGLFSRDVSGFGTGEDEIILNWEQAFSTVDREYEQIPKPARVHTKLLHSHEISDSLCILMALVTHEIMVTDRWEKFGPARYSALMQKEGTGWKVLHLHISEPWREQEQGESYPLKLLEEKNRILNEAVAEKTRELQEALLKMEKMATIDKLTGAYNRYKFEEKANHEISRARRYGHPLSLILMDIDRFKDINDSLGHLMGDTVLQQTAHIIANHLRDVDSLARWGGEEFIILLPNQSLEEAALAAERIRKLVSTNNFDGSTKVSVSMGVSQYGQGESLDDLLRRADRLLYQAKQTGRDRVIWKAS